VAQFSDGDVVDVHWVNEDRLIFGVVDFSEGSGRPVGAAGLFSVNADGTKFRRLVHRLGKPFLSDGGDARLLDWNHRLLQVPAPKEGEANDEVLLAQFSVDEHRRETPVWLNTRTGRTRAVLVDSPPDVVDWMADSHGELRVAFTQHEGRQAAYWRGPSSTKWEQLYDSALMERPFSINSLDDAGALYVTQSEGASGTNVLKQYDFAKHAPSDKPLFVTPGFDFRGGLIISDGVTLGVRLNVDAEATIWFAPAMTALQDKVDQALPGRINRISCRRCAQPDMIALVRSYSDRDPGQVFVYKSQPPAGDVPWHPVGKVRETINPQEMGQTDFHRIKARDGLDLPVWVTKPADAKGPLPAVVLVHGGPWVRGRFWRWDADAQFLATRGYVVIEPEMRGSTEWVMLYESGLLSRPFGVQGVDDAGTLYVTRTEGREGFTVLARYDFERKAPETKAVVATPGFDFNGQLLTEAGSGRALGVRVTVDAETTVWFSDDMKAFQQQADRLLPGHVNRVNCRRCGTPDMVALVRSYSDQDPGRLWLYRARPADG